MEVNDVVKEIKSEYGKKKDKVIKTSPVLTQHNNTSLLGLRRPKGPLSSLNSPENCQIVVTHEIVTENLNQGLKCNRFCTPIFVGEDGRKRYQSIQKAFFETSNNNTQQLDIIMK